MYIVRDKITKQILHTNPAPFDQDLAGRDVYFKFDSKTMEIGKSDSDSVPEHFNITAAGEIVEFTPAEKAAAGLLTLAPDEKIAGDQIVKKTLLEQVADGQLSLLETQKISGKGDGEEILEKTIDEMLKDGTTTLEEVKQGRIQYFSNLAFEKRAAILPDYKLQNALLGIYDEQTVANYKATVQAFRDEFYRLQALIEKAGTLKKIEAVTENFPKEIIQATPG